MEEENRGWKSIREDVHIRKRRGWKIIREDVHIRKRRGWKSKVGEGRRRKERMDGRGKERIEEDERRFTYT